MKKFVLLVGLLPLLFSQPATAACGYMTDSLIAWITGVGETEEPGVPNENPYPAQNLLTLNIPFPATFDIENDITIGDVITSAEVMIDKTAVLACAGKIGGTIYYDFFLSTTKSIEPTNVEGIGYRVIYHRSSNNAKIEFPLIQNVAPNPSLGDAYSILPIWGTFKVELIKTGRLKSISDVSFPKPLATITGDERKPGLKITANDIQIRQFPRCHVDKKTLDIDFGPFTARDVSATDGPTRPVEFDVICTGPYQPESVTATLSGTPDLIDPSLIKNTGAENLAIRLQDVATKTILKPNNTNSTITQNPEGEMKSAFSLNATVLRVGTKPPTGGKIDAIAVIVLSII